MTTKRVFFVMAGSVALFTLLIIAATIVGNNLLKEKATELSNLRAENQVIDDQKLALIQGKKDIEKYAELDQIAQSIVPKDKDQARTIREINAIAAESGIELSAFTFDASDLGNAPAAPQPTNPDSSAGATEGAAPSGPSTPQVGISQVKPVEGISGVYSLTITVAPAADQSITYTQFLSFLEKLENNRRTAHVDNITVSPTEQGGITFSLTLNVYLRP